MARQHKKRNKYSAFTLTELLVSIGIFSVLLMITTTTLTQMVRIKKTAERRAEVTDNLQTILETMKRHLLEAKVSEVECASIADPNTCDLCALGAVGSDRCDLVGGNLRFVYSPDQGTVSVIRGDPAGTASMTSENVKIDGVVFNQVGDYVFILLKGQDVEGKTIPVGQEVVIQGSVVLQSDD